MFLTMRDIVVQFAGRKGHHTPHLRQSATLSAILTGSPTVALTSHIPENILCKIVHLHHPPIIRRIGDGVADEVYGGLKLHDRNCLMD